MKLYKLDSGAIIEATDSIVMYIDSEPTSIINPTEQQLRNAGYKTLSKQNYPVLEWYETVNESYSEDADSIYLEYDVIPKQNILPEYMTLITSAMHAKLENDFLWAGKCVKLSESNQRDYIGMYTLLANNKDAISTFPCTFKDNKLHFFQDFDELNDFGLATTIFVNNELLILRSETYKVKDYTNDQLYQYLKSL